MSVLDEAIRLSSAGRRQEAVTLVEGAARRGDGEALFALANWRLFGLFGPRDLNAAHALLDQAIARGFVEAVWTKANLLASGGGFPANLSAAEDLLRTIAPRNSHAAAVLDFVAAMPPVEAFPPERAEVLSEAPVVKLYRGLLNEKERDYLIRLAEPQLQPSHVTDPTTGRMMPHPVRTSNGMNFGPTQEDVIVRRLNMRMAAVSGTDVACGEVLHILRYAPGQEYRPHNDAIPGEANQRSWTVLVYLNEGYSGGATVFPKLGIEVRAKAGDALIFCNVDADGQSDPATIHAGLPVTSGVKWLASRWIRTRPYDPWAG